MEILGLFIALSRNTTFHFKSQCLSYVLLRLVKMWDKRWEFGAGDSSRRLPGGQFTQRPAGRGHFRHLMTTESFASASHSIPPLVQYWLSHCVMLPPSRADMLLEQHRLYMSEQAWTAVKWWMRGQPPASWLLSLITDHFFCGNRQLMSFQIRAEMVC